MLPLSGPFSLPSSRRSSRLSCCCSSVSCTTTGGRSRSCLVAGVGPDVSGVSDDPEGAEVFEECQKIWDDQTDEAKAVWAGQGAEFPNLTGAQFDAFIKAELKKWGQVVKASGAKLD